MLLIYIDESGINQSLSNNNFYNDGPFIIWSGVFIPEKKYFHLERLFYDLAKNILGVNDWQSKELHATDIWQRKGDFQNTSEAKVKKYFEEVFQLLSKMDLRMCFTLQQKNPKLRSSRSKGEEMRRSIYAFLHGLEYQLSAVDETGVLIADGEVINSEEYTEMGKLLLDRTKWRNLGRKRLRVIPKYRYETQSCFILDQVNYTDSKKSLFIQLEDHICFVLNRVFTYLYLQQIPKKGIQADINKVPLSPDTFRFYLGQTTPLLVHWDEVKKDVTMTHISGDYINTTDYLNINLNQFSPFK